MKLWTIWIQAEDSSTWCEGAWDDESTAENHDGWKKAVDKAQKLANDNAGYAMRIISVEFPDAAVFGAFEPQTVKATAAAEGGKGGPA